MIIDAVREMRPPFSPTVVVDEFAKLLKSLSTSPRWLATTTAASS